MSSTRTIDRRLDVILEDETTQVGSDPYRNAINVANDLQQTRERIGRLERELDYANDRLCGGLAMGVRKLQPSLNVSLGGGCCRVSYKKKDLCFRPDLNKKMWTIESNRPKFGSRFRRTYGHAVNLIGDLSPMVHAVVDFFNGFYRSIGENIEGIGSSTVDGRRVTLSELAAVVAQKDRLLREVRTVNW